MAFVGGDFTEITYTHPTVGTGTIYPKSGEEGTLDLGGFRSDDEQEGIAGNGEMIDMMKRKRWSFEQACANDMNDAEELDKVVQMAESTEPADWTMTHINGAVYKGTGKPVGDIQGSSNSTFTLKISGGGKAKKIS